MPSEAERTISGTITSGTVLLPLLLLLPSVSKRFLSISSYTHYVTNLLLRKLLDSLSFSSLSRLLSAAIPFPRSRHDISLWGGGTYSSDPCVCDPGNIPPWLMVMFKILLRRETGAAGRINDDSSSSSSSSSSLTAAPVAFSMNDRRRNVRSKSETYFCIDHVAMGRSIVADLPCNRNRSRAVSHVIPRF